MPERDDFGLDDSDIDALEEQGWDIREKNSGENGSAEDENYCIKRRRMKPDRIFESLRSDYNDFDIDESNQIIEDAVKDMVFELEGPMSRAASIYSYKTDEEGRIEECGVRTSDGFIDGSLSYEKPFGSVRKQVIAEIDFYPQNDMTGKPYDVLREDAKRVDKVLEQYIPDMILPHFKLD